MKKYSFIIVFSFLFVAFLLSFQNILAAAPCIGGACPSGMICKDFVCVLDTNADLSLSHSKTIAWNPVAGATSYGVKVFKGTSTMPFLEKSVTGTTLLVTSLEKDVLYYYQVNAVNQVGASAYSARTGFKADTSTTVNAKTTIAAPVPCTITAADFSKIEAQLNELTIAFNKLKDAVAAAKGKGKNTSTSIVTRTLAGQLSAGSICEQSAQCKSWICDKEKGVCKNSPLFSLEKTRRDKAIAEFEVAAEAAQEQGTGLKFWGCDYQNSGSSAICYCGWWSGNPVNRFWCGSCDDPDSGNNYGCNIAGDQLL